jgi:lipopolysaccharide transport system permease protein
VIETLRAYSSHRNLLLNLTQRELRTRYRRSVLGWLWAMVNPALTTGVYSFVFLFIFNLTPEPGSPSGNPYFAFFLLSSTLPWNLLSAGLNGGIGSVIGGGALITRVYFPRQLIPTSSVISMTVSLFIELGVLILFELVFGYNVLKFIPIVIGLVILQTIFVLGLTLWLSALNVRYRDVQHLVGVVMLVWFYITPCLYAVSFIKERETIFGHSVPLRNIMMINPMSRFVDAYRSCLYDGRVPSLVTILYCVGWTGISFGIGSTYFARRSRRFAEEI